jgi:hypothetical protein
MSGGSSKNGRDATREFTVSALYGWGAHGPGRVSDRPLFIFNTCVNRGRRVVVSSRSVTSSSSKRRGLADC